VSRSAAVDGSVTVEKAKRRKWDDERFERAGQLELFDLPGARDEHVPAYPFG